MNARRLAVPAAGAAACFLLIGLFGCARRFAPVPNSPAAAQVGEPGVEVKAEPRTYASDDGWSRFDITAPASDPPLDMHVAFLVDGKGTDYITAQSLPWTRPTLLKLRLDNDDKRVKAILKAQGLPVDERRVTYHFAYQSTGAAAEDKTLKFLHSSAGPNGGIEETGLASARVGDKIMLYRSVVYDDGAFRSPLYKPLEDWHPDTLAAKYPPGFLHRLTIHLQFQPHQGPRENGIAFNSKSV